MTTKAASQIPPWRKILVTRDEAAALLDMSVDRFVKLVGKKKLPQACINPGANGARWSRRKLEEWLLQ